MANDDRLENKVFGDMDPKPGTEDHLPDEPATGSDEEDIESMHGGSRHDRTKHSGSRDVTEGVTVGTETGGTRNYRQGSGATGSDIGNRPE